MECSQRTSSLSARHWGNPGVQNTATGITRLKSTTFPILLLTAVRYKGKSFSLFWKDTEQWPSNTQTEGLSQKSVLVFEGLDAVLL